MEGILELVSRIPELLEMRVIIDNISWEVHLVIFYVTVALLLFVLLCGGYQTYVLYTRHQGIQWILSLLTVTFRLILSILYLPVLGTIYIYIYIEILVSILDCSREEENLVQSAHHEIDCFTLEHTLAVLVAICGILVFVILTIFASLLYFESYKYTPSASARIHSIPQTFTITIVTCLQFLWTFAGKVNIIYIYISILIFRSGNGYWVW